MNGSTVKKILIGAAAIVVARVVYERLIEPRLFPNTEAGA